jgi:hypothetical protein
LSTIPSYRASGSPGWEVEIGDDIVLRLGQNLDDSENLLIVDYRYPAVLARHHGDVRRWRSGGSRGILVEVRPGPCTNPGGQVLPDHVRVVHSKGEWQGCGGPWSGDNPA